jgi:hypothetical protein
MLNKNQKFWFYKDYAVFDAAGKVIGYNNELQYPGISLNHYSEFGYDEKGRLKEIREPYNEDDNYISPAWEVDFSGEITLDYREDNTLSSVNYGFYHFNHGTWDSSGKIRYDEKGRMIYREYYVTHGRHYCIYLYDGESTRPRAVIEFCQGVTPGDEDDYFGPWAYGVLESPMLLFR